MPKWYTSAWCNPNLAYHEDTGILQGCYKEFCVKPLKRHSVNKHRAAKHFKHATKRTHPKNVHAPMRGGWRL